MFVLQKNYALVVNVKITTVTVTVKCLMHTSNMSSRSVVFAMSFKQRF